MDDTVRDVHRLLQWAIDERLDLDGLEVTRPSLEDVYLALTNSLDGDESHFGAPKAERGQS